MNKTKFAVFAGIVGTIAAFSIIAAQADTTPLSVTCGGSVSNNQITWTAYPTGGNSPYTLAWTGDSSVAGSTSTALNATYSANGTYTADIQVTDASSTMATSTCSATVTSIITPTPTSTVNVFVSVNNTNGGTAIPANFTMDVNGAGAVPSAFAGSGTGTAVTVNAGATYTVSAVTAGNYTASYSGDCSNSLATGASASCTVTETYVSTVTTPTSTPPLPRVNQPSLSIGPNGAFLARGMTVTSVASGSFQATVWGITYTVNWSGNLYPEFYFRNGNGGNTATNPTNQVSVGDEVGVSGRIVGASSPMVVNAQVVRDYSITQPRPIPQPFPFGGEGYGNQNNGQNGNHNGSTSNNGNGNANGSIGVSSSINADFNTRIGNLLNQLHNLQNLFKGHGN